MDDIEEVFMLEEIKIYEKEKVILINMDILENIYVYEVFENFGYLEGKE